MKFLGEILKVGGMERNCLIERTERKRTMRRERERNIDTLLDSIDQSFPTWCACPTSGTYAERALLGLLKDYKAIHNEVHQDLRNA